MATLNNGVIYTGQSGVSTTALKKGSVGVLAPEVATPPAPPPNTTSQETWSTS